jgi:hypothetical protein
LLVLSAAYGFADSRPRYGFTIFGAAVAYGFVADIALYGLP